jgi:uncharacterized protein
VRQQEKKRRSVVAYVAPFVLYIVPTMFESSGWSGLNYETVCTLKGLLAAAALWAFRHHYPRFSTAGFGLAIVAGGLGCVIWIVLERLQTAIPGMQQLMTDVLHASRVGYDPFSSDAPAATRTAFVVVRLIELALIVPVMEEVFWRGFLARYLIANDFVNVPQGDFTRFSFLFVTVAFASVHPEILAAITWGALINLVYRKTANLWACVVMHAVTNGLLGAYILATGTWHLW